MGFYQREGSKTYHTMTTCSRVPRNVKTSAEWSVRTSKPKGKMCVECVAKAKPKAKPKKKVTKRKSAARSAARKTRRKK